MIVVTAGHVDHGKSSLVKSLTGVDTDRLPEEKKRGMSIDLGFAYMQLAASGTSAKPNEKSGLPQQIAFIDVPGHEKFVRNMIAGVSAVDAALLVIAADDGPMPQTAEHLSILQLLNVPALFVVISKVDLVDEARLATVHDEITDLLQTSRYIDAPVFKVSVNEPASVDQIRVALSECQSQSRQQVQQQSKQVQHQSGEQSFSGIGSDDGAFFRMCIDRQFSIPGAGTVVTGTVTTGQVELETELFTLAGQVPLRVRGIHAQNQVAEKAMVGQRCALNLAGNELKRASLQRGEWLTTCQALQPVNYFDVTLTVSLQNTHLKHWTPAHFHVGAADVLCRIALLGSQEVASGESAYARIICDKPVGVCYGDHFVLRDQSARSTIAGGSVIDPLPPRRGRSRPERLAVLAAMDQPTRWLALQELIASSSTGVSLNRFSLQFNVRPSVLAQHLKPLENIVVTRPDADAWVFSSAHWTALQAQVRQTLLQWHENNTDSLGADVEQLHRSIKPRVARSVLLYVLGQLCASEEVLKRGAVYRLAGRESSLGPASEKLWAKVLPLYQQGKPIAPRVVEISESLQLSVADTLSLLNSCVAHGRLYKVSDNRYFLPEDLYHLALIAEKLASSEDFTVAGYRDESGIGRNLVVELLEFFDRVQFTRRLGQQRVLLQSASQVFED